MAISRQISVDSGVAHCTTNDGSLDKELTVIKVVTPPNYKLSDGTASLASEFDVVTSMQSNTTGSNIASKPIDYTVVALFTSIAAPFMGVPAFIYARKCKEEYRKGDLEKAWRYSWVALYFVLAGLFVLCLIFAGLFIAIILRTNTISTTNCAPYCKEPNSVSLRNAIDTPTATPSGEKKQQSFVTHSDSFKRFLAHVKPGHSEELASGLQNFTYGKEEQIMHHAVPRRRPPAGPSESLE